MGNLFVEKIVFNTTTKLNMIKYILAVNNFQIKEEIPFQLIAFKAK